MSAGFGSRSAGNTATLLNGTKVGTGAVGAWMGIYDRDYYRDDNSNWWASLDGRWVTVRFIVVLAVVFVAQLFTKDAGEPLLRYGAFSLPDILDGQVWRLLTPYFLQPLSLLGVVLNLYLLYWAGSEVESIYGPREYLGFLGATAVVCSISGVAVGLAGGGRGAFLGAPALIAGVFVLFACHYPTQRVLIFFVLPVPVWLIAAVVVGASLLAAVGPTPGLAPVAVLAAAGFAIAYHQTQIRVTALLPAAGRRKTTPRLRVYPEPDDDDVPVAAASGPARGTAVEAKKNRALDEQLEAKLDEVLEKVARSGRDSLSPDENAILLRASEIYKRRRS